jgi:hypothetical protein
LLIFCLIIYVEMDESQKQEDEDVNSVTDDMQHWMKSLNEDHEPKKPQQRKISLGGDRGRRVSAGYQEIGQQLQMQKFLKEMSKRQEPRKSNCMQVSNLKRNS